MSDDRYANSPVQVVQVPPKFGRKPPTQAALNTPTGSRYGATRAVMAMLRVLAIAGVVVTIVSIALARSAWDSGGWTMVDVAAAAASVVLALLLLAAAEGLQIIIDMEDHQRALRGHLAKLAGGERDFR